MGCHLLVRNVRWKVSVNCGEEYTIAGGHHHRLTDDTKTRQSFATTTTILSCRRTCASSDHSQMAGLTSAVRISAIVNIFLEVIIIVIRPACPGHCCFFLYYFLVFLFLFVIVSVYRWTNERT